MLQRKIEFLEVLKVNKKEEGEMGEGWVDVVRIQKAKKIVGENGRRFERFCEIRRI